MRINNVENAQNFGSIYKVRATMQNIKRFDEAAAPLYRSLKKKGIRSFVKNVSEMYVMTEKDAYEFDKKFNQLLRDKVELQSKVKKPADNVIIMPAEEYDFVNSFLRGKSINAVNGFKNLLIKIFS
jgi:hypothetical protein